MDPFRTPPRTTRALSPPRIIRPGRISNTAVPVTSSEFEEAENRMYNVPIQTPPRQPKRGKYQRKTRKNRKTRKTRRGRK